MRVVAMVLFALALAKIGLVAHLQQAGARDVVVAAYGAEAIRACEAADDRLKLARLSAGSIDMTVGDRSRAVALWQVDHIDWAGRYRRVYLDVKTTGGDMTQIIFISSDTSFKATNSAGQGGSFGPVWREGGRIGCGCGEGSRCRHHHAGERCCRR